MFQMTYEELAQWHQGTRMFQKGRMSPCTGEQFRANSWGAFWLHDRVKVGAIPFEIQLA